MNTPAAPFVIEKIDRLGLSAAVGARVRDMIVEGTLAPGTRLNERVLCEQLNVSRTPLREAFKALAVEGLIVLQPNRGAVVAQMSVPEIEHTFEVMGSLEGLSGELACARASDGDIADVRALYFEMLAAHARRDLTGYYKLNHAIHDRFNAMAGNPVLTETYQRINARIQSLRFRSNFNQDKWDAAVREHGAMQHALERRDGETMRRILQQHLRNKRDAVISVLRAAQAVSGADTPA